MKILLKSIQLINDLLLCYYFINLASKVPHFKFTLHNTTAYTFEPGSFRIGVLSPPKFESTRERKVTSIKLPDGRNIHMLPYLDTLFPNSFSLFKVLLDNLPDLHMTEEFCVRIFTEVGTYDYPFFVELDEKLTKPKDDYYIKTTI